MAPAAAAGAELSIRPQLLGLRGGGPGTSRGYGGRAARPATHRALPSLASGRIRSRTGAEGLRDGSETFLACSCANVPAALHLRAALRPAVPPSSDDAARDRAAAAGTHRRAPGGRAGVAAGR